MHNLYYQRYILKLYKWSGMACRISDTSALVSLLDDPPTHTSHYSVEYRKQLDLSSGLFLLEKCTNIWPYLSELVKNRKKCIMDEVLHCLSDKVKQVLILGSGIDSLSLELASRVPNVQIYEIDMEQMITKRNLMRNVASEIDDYIKFVEADLRKPQELRKRLVLAGWHQYEPSILVLEGISYYIGADALWGLISTLGKNASNYVVLEYIVPSGMIHPLRSHIPSSIFETIVHNLSDNMEIYRFGYDTVLTNLEKICGKTLRRYTTKDMEFTRLGSNPYFPTDRDGWLEVVCIQTTRAA